MFKRFKLQSILVFGNVLVLIFLVLVLLSFRFYQTELIRQTEGELISQGAVFAASYREELLKINPDITKELGKIHLEKNAHYSPIEPQLSLTSIIYPPRPDGVLESSFDVKYQEIGKHFSKLINETQRTTLAGIKVLDWNGVVIASQKEVGVSFKDLIEVKNALQGKYSSVLRERVSEKNFKLSSISREGQYRVFVAFPVISEQVLLGVIYLSRTPKNILKDLYHKKYNALGALGLILLLVILTSVTLSLMISSPIKKLIQAIDTFRNFPEKPIQLAKEPIIDEYHQLAEAFNLMSVELLDRSNYIKQFAMDVSHEFKTPITAINGAVEILRDHFETIPKEKAIQFLGNIQLDTQRLHALTIRLLQLAEADNALRPSSSCSSAEVFEKLRLRYESRDIDLSLPKEKYIVAISAEDLETILINLIDNSIQHDAKVVSVQFDSAQQLIIEDNGSGISLQNSQKIFNPFFTTRREQGGTGLGLRIVQSLLKHSKAEISLGDSVSGTKFIIKFQNE